jgi:arginase family enzyme
MVTFPIATGLAAACGPLSILHFDAHPDLYDDFGGDPLSHASPFARIMKNKLASKLVQVGIRTADAHCSDQANRFGVTTVAMRGFAPERVPIPEGHSTSASTWTRSTRPSPGVSHLEPGGLSVRDILSVLQRLRGRSSERILSNITRRAI